MDSLVSGSSLVPSSKRFTVVQLGFFGRPYGHLGHFEVKRWPRVGSPVNAPSPHRTAFGPHPQIPSVQICLAAVLEPPAACQRGLEEERGGSCIQSRLLMPQSQTKANELFTCVAACAHGVALVAVCVFGGESRASGVRHGVGQVTGEVAHVKDVVFRRPLHREVVLGPVLSFPPVFHIHPKNVDSLLCQAVDLLQAQPEVLCI